MTRRRPSLLEDDALAAIVSNEDETSDGDVCDGCGCPRRHHEAGGCACGKCDGFKEEEP